jgi:hypothetical protein
MAVSPDPEIRIETPRAGRGTAGDVEVGEVGEFIAT